LTLLALPVYVCNSARTLRLPGRLSLESSAVQSGTSDTSLRLTVFQAEDSIDAAVITETVTRLVYDSSVAWLADYAHRPGLKSDIERSHGPAVELFLVPLDEVRAVSEARFGLFRKVTFVIEAAGRVWHLRTRFPRYPPVVPGSQSPTASGIAFAAQRADKRTRDMQLLEGWKKSAPMLFWPSSKT
jgi:hypothetical protein